MSTFSCNIGGFAKKLRESYKTQFIASLYDEILVLSNAIRFYNPDILAKVACGKSLTDIDRELIAKSLENDQNVFKKL